MQQTEKYKLNLIESSDPFLPDALNQNTQKIEDAMTAHEEGIEQRLTAVESHKLLLSTYTGDSRSSGTQAIHIGFCPRFLMIWSNLGVWPALLPELGSAGGYAVSLEDGFTIQSAANILNQEYQFLAYR